MKTFRIHSLLTLSALTAGLLVLPGTVAAQDDSSDGGLDSSGAPKIAKNRVISIMPSNKMPLLLKADERNPFARRNPDVDLITEETEQETEADFIRDVLNALPITGRTMGPKGPRILAGEIIFERGELVDHVIQDQTENLIVENISDHTIELAWIDMETGKLSGKRLTLTYDLSPKIRYRLKGAGLRRSLNGAAPAEEETQDLAQQFGIFRPQTPEVPDADQINPNQRPNNIPERVFTEGQ